MKIRSFGKTDVGKKRKQNEDNLKINEDKRLYIVADGMGGHNAGEVASKMACNLYSEKFNPTAGDIEQEMKEVFEQVNDDVFKDSKENLEHYGMKTTLIVSHIEDNTIHIAHAGDVRCYLFRDGFIKLLTEDHTLVFHLVKKGIITPEEAKKHPMRSQVANSIGNEQKVNPDYTSVTMKDGDLFLLCSDGLWNMVEDDGIKAILEDDASLEEKANTLIEKSNDNGGKDNITVLLIQIEEEAKDDKMATQSYDKATDIDPKYAKVWNNKGLAYEKLGDVDKAKECRDIAKKIKEGGKTQYGK